MIAIIIESISGTEKMDLRSEGCSGVGFVSRSVVELDRMVRGIRSRFRYSVNRDGQ